ncbi:hypothetical protein OWS73_33630 [Burkholderia sp. 1B3(2022)]|uniref:hypothetical protein n=1 Tax=Burkholderia sp. 1B3(2022) TaxID=2997425 RepID=UPI002FC81DC7
MSQKRTKAVTAWLLSWSPIFSISRVGVDQGGERDAERPAVRDRRERVDLVEPEGVAVLAGDVAQPDVLPFEQVAHRVLPLDAGLWHVDPVCDVQGAVLVGLGPKVTDAVMERVQRAQLVGVDDERRVFQRDQGVLHRVSSGRATSARSSNQHGRSGGLVKRRRGGFQAVPWHG